MVTPTSKSNPALLTSLGGPRKRIQWFHKLLSFQWLFYYISFLTIQGLHMACTVLAYRRTGPAIELHTLHIIAWGLPLYCASLLRATATLKNYLKSHPVRGSHEIHIQFFGESWSFSCPLIERCTLPTQNGRNYNQHWNLVARAAHTASIGEVAAFASVFYCLA